MKTRSGIFGTAGWLSLKFRFNKARISGIHFHGDLIGEMRLFILICKKNYVIARIILNFTEN